MPGGMVHARNNSTWRIVSSRCICQQRNLITRRFAVSTSRASSSNGPEIISLKQNELACGFVRRDAPTARSSAPKAKTESAIATGHT